MFHRVVRVGRVVTLAAIAVVAVAMVALVAERWDMPGLAFALALAAGALVAVVGWRWAWRPIEAQVEAVTRARDALVEQVDGGHAKRVDEPPELSPATERAFESPVRPAEAVCAQATNESASRADGQVAALIELGLRSSLRQAALAMEKVAELAPDPEGLRLLLSLGYSASVRAQELLAGFERHSGALERTAGDQPRRAPFALREDIAANVRAIGFELGCEVALRFSTNFPAHATVDAMLFRLALAAVVLECAARGPEGAELLIEASHEDLVGANVNVRLAVSATGAATIGELPCYVSHAGEKRVPALLGVSLLVQTGGGHLYGNPAGTQLGFALPVTRYKRVTGTTLYGLGALSDRSVLVIDPRPIGRVTICEQLAAWRLSPKGVASIEEAVEVAERARANNERCDLIVLSGFLADQPDRVLELARQLPLFGCTRVLSLEDVETACQPLLPELAQVPELVLRRMPRPPSPNDLIELLTDLLVQPPEVNHEVVKRGPGLSLLVAEDNAVNQALMLRVLERRGHSVRVSDNGAEVVDRLWEAPGEYDAVLMDIQMPVMDGYEATAVIRLREARSRRARIPIIAVTAHAIGGERERCLEAGMDGYLAKPIVEAELTALLEALAARSRPEAKEPAPERSPTDAFDRQLVLELAAGDMGFLKGLVDLLGQSAPKLVDQIAAHLAAAEPQSAYRLAHQLKGSIGNFGADRARAAASEIEELARLGEVALAIERTPHLKNQVDALIAALRGLVREVDG